MEVRNMFFTLVLKAEIMSQETLTVGQQVEAALDGRTQRWLALKAGIPESDLSKKMAGKMDFNASEIDRINEILKSEIQIQNIK